MVSDQNEPTHNKPPPGPLVDSGARLLAAHVFRCGVCPEEAGTVMVWLDGSLVKLERASFTGSMLLTIPNELLSEIIADVVRGDTRALFEFDREICPFLCNSCDQVMCGKHWTWWTVFDDDGWQDSIRGFCPQRHERMLED